MGGGSPILFLLPAFAGSYETKERGILPDATFVRQAAQVQVAPCAAGSHCASHHRDATHPNSRGVSNAAAERTKRRLFFREEREQLLDQVVGTLLSDPMAAALDPAAPLRFRRH